MDKLEEVYNDFSLDETGSYENTPNNPIVDMSKEMENRIKDSGRSAILDAMDPTSREIKILRDEVKSMSKALLFLCDRFDEFMSTNQHVMRDLSGDIKGMKILIAETNKSVSRFNIAASKTTYGETVTSFTNRGDDQGKARSEATKQIVHGTFYSMVRLSYMKKYGNSYMDMDRKTLSFICDMFVTLDTKIRSKIGLLTLNFASDVFMLEEENIKSILTDDNGMYLRTPLSNMFRHLKDKARYLITQKVFNAIVERPYNFDTWEYGVHNPSKKQRVGWIVDKITDSPDNKKFKLALSSFDWKSVERNNSFEPLIGAVRAGEVSESGEYYINRDIDGNLVDSHTRTFLKKFEDKIPDGEEGMIDLTLKREARRAELEESARVMRETRKSGPVGDMSKHPFFS